MSRINRALTAAALFAIAMSLPFYFFQYRIERLRCNGGLDYEHCSAGTPYTLILPLSLVGRGPAIPYANPPLAFYVEGIYARRGYSGLTAKIGGIASPLLLSCIAVYFSVRAVTRRKSAANDTTKIAR